MVFDAGETSKTVLVGTTDDSVVESAEVFQVSLSRLGPGVVIGQPSDALVTILDNDGGKLEKV